jgi:hypothetical protein
VAHVLIDAEWRGYVERVRPRLTGGQHVATVFSRREDGVRRFLDALRAYPRDLHGPPAWPA